MSTFIEDFKTGLIAAVVAFWPDTKADGVYESEDLDSFPWADTEIPFAVYKLGPLSLSGDFGTTNNAYICPAQIILVAETDGVLDALQQSLEDAMNYLKTTDPANGQVITVDGMDWSIDVAGNHVFSEKDYTQRAAQISVTFLIGETGP